ncbi:alpha-ketoglutarate-dependent dioxygenase alkB homolog 6-like [Panicum virgatum]|uniref:alpha-ketoglutarate-dependent dioxygenase alkB homolog 6-like n=1 Tax=Panicum virgatum TaxID=38727 RepID=UPI0019D629F1|nr:alpha-ketoglutarate-dependent dioxygenase alkB homolog 6-like [Panicum virgatum]
MEDTTTQEAAAAAAERPSSALALRSLADYTVGAIPTLFYVPDFISNSEQSQLLHHIYQAPAPKWKSLKNRRLQNWGGVVHEKGLLPQALPSWLTRITDRICQWTGLFPSAINHVLINEYHPNQGIMPHQDGPAYYPVVAIISLASPVVIDFTPHQRLKEQEHTDPQNLQIDELTGPAKMESNGSGSHERGATNESDPACSSLMLMPCSLLIFKDQAYTDYLHGIQDNELHNLDKVKNLLRCPELKHLSSDSIQGSMDKQRGTFRRTATRVSLTCRLVLKVHKKLFKI